MNLTPTSATGLAQAHLALARDYDRTGRCQQCKHLTDVGDFCGEACQRAWHEARLNVCDVCGQPCDRDLCDRCHRAWLDEDRRIELRDDHAADHDTPEPSEDDE